MTALTFTEKKVLRRLQSSLPNEQEIQRCAQFNAFNQGFYE
jgi:hypothetical protein